MKIYMKKGRGRRDKGVYLKIENENNSWPQTGFEPAAPDLRFIIAVRDFVK